MLPRSGGPQLSDSDKSNPQFNWGNGQPPGVTRNRIAYADARYIGCDESHESVSQHLLHHRRGAVIAIPALVALGLLGGAALNHALDSRTDNPIPAIVGTPLPTTGP